MSIYSIRYYDIKQIYILSLNTFELAKSIFRVLYSLYILLSSYLPSLVLAIAILALVNTERTTIVITTTSNIL
jgi:hypothetical protein